MPKKGADKDKSLEISYNDIFDDGNNPYLQPPQNNQIEPVNINPPQDQNKGLVSGEGWHVDFNSENPKIIWDEGKEPKIDAPKPNPQPAEKDVNVEPFEPRRDLFEMLERVDPDTGFGEEYLENNRQREVHEPQPVLNPNPNNFNYINLNQYGLDPINVPTPTSEHLLMTVPIILGLTGLHHFLSNLKAQQGIKFPNQK